MPNIKVSLSDVKAYDNLPVAKYLGQIDSISYQEPTDPSKNESLKVTYVVIDGDLIGRKSSQWLYFTEKAIFRTKKFFDKFGLGDIDLVDESFDPDTNELIDPDLHDVRVIFQVTPDKPRPGETEPTYRTSLVSVEDDDIPAPAPKAVAEPSKKAVAGDPVDEKAAKRAELAAQLAALEADDDDGDEAEAAPAPKAAAKPKTVAEAQPRRKLR